MEAIATCIEGLESITQLEIKDIIKKKSEILTKSRVKFNVKSDLELANFIYNTRSAIKAYKLITSFTFTDFQDLINKAKKVKFLKIKEPFAVKCERFGEHDFSSIDIEKEIGHKIKGKVDLEDPSTIVLIDVVDKNCIIGIDFTGIKLSKRHYRIRLAPNSLNSCLAYSMLKIADVKTKDIVLDPFCRSGEIPIETVLYLKNISPQKKLLDKLAFTKLVKFKLKDNIKNNNLNIYSVDSSQNNLKSAEINAKIAGINKDIKFSRYEIEWLDTKFKKNSVNKIITFPQYPTNNIRKEIIEKTYNEFFYQSEFILNPKGIIIILTPVPDLIEKYATKHKFKKDKEIKINYMHQPHHIIQFKK